MTSQRKSRRKFIKDTCASLAYCGLASLSTYTFPKNLLADELVKEVNFGFITDLHHGFCHDALERLQVFIDEASDRPLDFIIQGGDFCYSEAEAQECIDLWNTYGGPKYHVLGNHDMDKGTKADIMQMWGMRKPYYSFDRGPFHFVVLDGNYILDKGKYVDYAHANFYIEQKNRSLFSPEQIEWLREDLNSTNKQTIIISHQALDEIWDGWSSPNRLEVRDVIDAANGSVDGQKVIACFCGHHHLDEHSIINDVHYFQMNSASYYYAGEGFGSDGSRATYSNPLFSFITVSSDGNIIIEGRKGAFKEPTPLDLGHPDALKLSASIRDRVIAMGK